MNKKYLTIITIVLLLMMALLTACSSSDGDSENAEAPAATATSAEEITDTDAEGHDDDDTDEGETEGHDDDGDSDAAGDDAAATGGQTFVVVPGESTASYIVNEEFLAGALSKLGIEAGKTVVTGSTDDVEGSLTIDLANSALSDGAITVNLTTLTTDQDRRDGWVQKREPQFGQFPSAEFVATGIEGAPAGYTEGEEASFQLVGDLTVRDITMPATFDVTATVADGTLTGVAEANMNISDFGINPPNFANTLTVEDPFVIRVELTAMAE